MEISRNGKFIYRKLRPNFQTGEVVFTWNGRQAHAGRYEINVIAEQEVINRPTAKFERRFNFEHNPNWLK
ncbi:MAG: hypothetical protein HEQ35_23220 [Gloeotrichia echinulata IR180]|nr:hypothetical protein [Gloeotrichia echinulata DEX184]